MAVEKNTKILQGKWWKIKKNIQTRIEAKYDKIKDWVMDPKGYFLIRVDRETNPTATYFLNTEFERQTIDKIKQSEAQSDHEPWEAKEDRANIYSLYEQNIGILTPIVAEKIGEAEQKYPVEWIEQAISEAVSLNSRSWRYISRILERWEIEGKEDGKSRKHTGKARYI